MFVNEITVDPISSDQNSGFVRELFVKDPSPDRIQMKVGSDRQLSEEHSPYIKAAPMPQYEVENGYDANSNAESLDEGDQPFMDAGEEICPAQSLDQSSPDIENHHGCYDDGNVAECASIGSESRMIFNPAFSMYGGGAQNLDDYPKTVAVDRRGDLAELKDLDARREKLNALRAAVRSLESSRAPSRETSFTGTALDSENMVDLESIAGRTLPPRPDGVPELRLPGMDQTSDRQGMKGDAKLEKERTSFFATVRRALTPPRFRRPISAAESNAIDQNVVMNETNEMSETNISRTSMGSFTKVLMEVDEALGTARTKTAKATKTTTFDARNF